MKNLTDINQIIGYTPEGVYEGQGTYYFENGDVYTGAFEKGKFNGVGKLQYKVSLDKCYYEGEFKNDKCHGKGTFYHFSTIQEGNWANDRYVEN